MRRFRPFSTTRTLNPFHTSLSGLRLLAPRQAVARVRGLTILESEYGSFTDGLASFLAQDYTPPWLATSLALKLMKMGISADHPLVQ
jgi:hypothetical protein